MSLTASQQKLIMQSHLFSGCNSAHYLPLIQSLEPVSLSKGQVLEEIPNGGQSLCFLLSGKVDFCSDNGVVFATCAAPYIFGLELPFLRGNPPLFLPKLQASNSAATITFLPESSLHSILRTDSSLAMNMLQLQADRICQLTGLAYRFSAASPSVRLALFLLQNAKENRLHLSSGIATLARSLDVSRATLYRSFDELKERKLIQKSEKTITIIDAEALTVFVKAEQKKT